MKRIYHILIFLGLVAVVHPPIASPQQLEIHCIDVGQGSSELVIGPNGTTILIDGGTSSKGHYEVIPYLDALFSPATPALDYIIASHDDNDHYGGLNYIIDYSGYSIGTIYHCGDNSDFGEGVQIPLGTVIDLGDGARATCVGRYGEFIDGSPGYTSSNNLSVCLLIEYGSFDYVTAGDLEGNENYLSAALIGYPPADPYLNPTYGVDVIHVNHHGSNSSSLANYVNRLKHELAVINGGTNYGHPRWTAVDRLKGRDHYSDGSGATNVTWTGCTNVYRTTYDFEEDGRAPEWDCPTLNDMVITYERNSLFYYLSGTEYFAAYPVDEPLPVTPTPTPEGYKTPTPTPTTTPTPEGYKTATPTATPSPNYCDASGGCDEYISRVQFNTIDNSSGCDGYADYTALSTVLIRESAYGIIVTNPNLYNGDECDLWVDWNQSKNFYDAGESTTLAGGPGVFTGTITGPAGALLGETRLRIRVRYYQDVEPCGNFTYGEVEDYTVIVVPLVTPTPAPSPSPSPTLTPRVDWNQSFEDWVTETSLEKWDVPASFARQTDNVRHGDYAAVFIGNEDCLNFIQRLPEDAPRFLEFGVWMKMLETDGEVWGRVEYGCQEGPGGGYGEMEGNLVVGPTEWARSSLRIEREEDWMDEWIAISVCCPPAGSETVIIDAAWIRDYSVPSPTPTPTPPIPTPTPSSSPPPSATPTPSAIPTPSPTLTPVPTSTPVSTPTNTPTVTPSPATPKGIYDYNGDGTSDIAIFRGNSGLWAIRGLTRVYFGGMTDESVPGDYNGDGTTDIGIFRAASGLWAIRSITRAYFGSSNDLPEPGDYDGDGTAVIGVFRNSASLWAIRGITRVYFGGAVDSPAPGYYNGDAIKDMGIFRGSSGLWAIRNVTRMYFGSSSDTIVSGDYDGSGTWEAGIFRGSSGLWAVRGLTRTYFGGGDDRPVPADYDGDSGDDIGIFRDSSGLWALRGISRLYFGTDGDIPETR